MQPACNPYRFCRRYHATYCYPKCNYLTHDIGTEYSDPGAIWFDVIDGEGDLLGVGDLNVSKLGIYVLSYSKTDLAGNVTEVNRTIEVINPLPQNLRSTAIYRFSRT